MTKEITIEFEEDNNRGRFFSLSWVMVTLPK